MASCVPLACKDFEERQSFVQKSGFFPESVNVEDFSADFVQCVHILGPFSAIKQRGWERKGSPEIIQKVRLRNWPISSADFPMTLMEGTEHRFGPFQEKECPAPPLFSRPLCFTADFWGDGGKPNFSANMQFLRTSGWAKPF